MANNSRTFDFTVGMCGKGGSPEEAWRDAIANFLADPPQLPEYEEQVQEED